MSQPDPPESAGPDPAGPDRAAPEPGPSEPDRPQPAPWGTPPPPAASAWEPSGWTPPGAHQGPPQTAPDWPQQTPDWPQPAAGWSQPAPGWSQPAPGWPQQTPGWPQQAAGWPQTPPGGPPGFSPAQPGGLPPYGWATGTRFDPADPLISDDYSGWWRRSTAVLRRGWRSLLTLHLLFVVPMLALQIPAQIYAERQQRAAGTALGDPTGAPDVMAVVGPALVPFAAALVAGFVEVLAVLAAMRLVAVIANGGDPRISDALGTAVRRLPAMTGWYVLSAFLGLAALLACVLPVIYVAAVLTILPAVVLFERGGAIPRCFRLFHADLGTAISRVATLFGLAFAGSMVFGIISIVVGLALQGTAVFDTSADVSSGSIVAVGTLTALTDTVYAVVVGVVGVPLIVAAYADLRARYEPFTSAALLDNPVT